MTAPIQDVAEVQREKQAWRDGLALRGLPGANEPGLFGKAAELLRREASYRTARQVFVSPVPALQQVRINCLLDGKDLLIPAPGLKEGFYLLKPYTVPFSALPHAVSLKGFPKYGRKLRREELESLVIPLLVTGATAVDRQGGRLGDGLGFFDLSHAILSELGVLAPERRVITFVREEQLVDSFLPRQCWDVLSDVIVTEQHLYSTEHAAVPPGRIFWELLTENRIRKVTPLWWLRGQGNYPAV
ncbi:MAG: 5-formyltetrahydrofolate cyclo-ligase [Deltaproteobacteria bacterium]|nr:5-formyltetrahydrofolate cyclo-ligase [Deltaproteobacteria bacterium]